MCWHEHTGVVNIPPHCEVGGGAVRVGIKTGTGLHTHLVFVTLRVLKFLSAYLASLLLYRPKVAGTKINTINGTHQY